MAYGRAMTQLPVSLTFSDDQAAAWDRLAELLGKAGIDILDEATTPPDPEGDSALLAVLGKAGSGKTMLLAQLTKALIAAGVEPVSGDYEGRRRKDRRTLAILAPTNKAASVLRNRGVPATTIHRILYTPLYDPEYEKIAEWLAAMTVVSRTPGVDPWRAGGGGAARVGFHQGLEASRRAAGYRLCR